MSPVPSRYGDPASRYGVARYSSATAPAQTGGKRMGDHVAQNTKGLDPVELATKARRAITAATTPAGAAIIATPAELAALTTATATLEAANTNLSGKRAELATAENDVLNAAAGVRTAYGKYCKVADNACDGDDAKITTLDLDIAGKAAPRTMVQVANLKASPGDQEGSADWMCDPQAGALFNVESSPDSTPRVWTPRGASKKSSGTVPGLPSLTRVWLRVNAQGSNNTGAWSDPALVNVP